MYAGIGTPKRSSTVGAMSRSSGVSVTILRLHQKTPGTRRGSTQWSPDHDFVLSVKTSRETDRFKDAAVRLTLTPLANSKGLFSTAAITAWGYKGAIASRFVAGGAGQVGTVGEGLRRDRWGVFAGNRDRRLTLGAEWAQRADEGELGDNTPASPRAVVDSTGTLLSGFAIARPLEWLNPGKQSKLALMGRYDRFRFNEETAPESTRLITGVIWDLDRRLSLAADYQQLLPREGATGLAIKTWFLHVQAAF